MEFENWILFLSIAFMASLTPGPAVLLATTHSLVYGLRKTIATISGNITGLFIMSAFSVLGLSTIIFLSAPVFTVVKYIGAAYLIYLGIKLWRQGFGISHPASETEGQLNNSQSIFKLYLHGLFVALSNPKAILFTTALFPQFLNHNEPIFIQFVILIVTFMTSSFSCLFFYAYLTQHAKNKSKGLEYSKSISKVFGATFIAAGAFLVNVTEKQT